MKRPRLCKIENGELRAFPEEVPRLARALKCRPQDLDVNCEPTFLYPAETREKIRRFLVTPEYDYVHERTPESRLYVIRKQYGVDVDRLLADPAMDRFVHQAYFGSAMEMYYWTERNRLESAAPGRVAPLQVGFDRHPVVDPVTRRIIGHCPLPAMTTDRWLAILQVPVLTPRFYQMDALVVTLDGGKRRQFALELDGPGKPPPDPERERALGLHIIRFSYDEIMAGVGIGDKLDRL